MELAGEFELSGSKALVFGLAALGLVSVPLAAGAKDACYRGNEWPAFNVKVMQEMLQDTALQCENVTGHNHDASYNALIARTRSGIATDGQTFKAHFKRLYGRGWENKLDMFTTRIENVAQSNSMTSMTYCRDSDVLFNDVQLATAANLETVAIAFNQAHFPDLSDLGILCAPKKVRIQVASHVTHHHHHPKKIASAD